MAFAVRWEKMSQVMVYTAGYAGLSLHQLVIKAEELDAVVIDVRMKPFARNPDFRSGPMVKALGVRYLHVGDLGNVNYKNDGPVELADERAGLERVERILKRGVPIILLCGCWNVDECHRKVVAERLADRGYEVAHLYRSDFQDSQGRDEPKDPQLSLFD